jgi:hypothetical protein
MTMPEKNKKSKLKLSSRAGDDPIAKGEIDILRYLVRSELGKEKNDKDILTETSFGEINVNL